MSRPGWIRGALLGLLLAAGSAPASAQVALYATFGASLNSYNGTTGAFVSQLDNSLSNPWAIAFDSSGKLYTSLYTGNTVAVFQTQPGVGGGTLVTSSLLSPGVGYATGLAVSGNLLYLASQQNQSIGLYNATTGAIINSSFIANVTNPAYLALDGLGRLFVTNSNSTVSVYNASTGAAISPNFITGLGTPMGLAVDAANNRLYVASTNSNLVGVYDATTGAVINASLITGLTNPRALALDPSGNLYVSSFSVANSYYVVGKFNPLTGATLNGSVLIAGTTIGGLGFTSVPEPATWAMLLAGMGFIGLIATRRR